MKKIIHSILIGVMLMLNVQSFAFAKPYEKFIINKQGYTFENHRGGAIKISKDGVKTDIVGDNLKHKSYNPSDIVFNTDTTDKLITSVNGEMILVIERFDIKGSQSTFFKVYDFNGDVIMVYVFTPGKGSFALNAEEFLSKIEKRIKNKLTKEAKKLGLTYEQIVMLVEGAGSVDDAKENFEVAVDQEEIARETSTPLVMTEVPPMEMPMPELPLLPHCEDGEDCGEVTDTGPSGADQNPPMVMPETMPEAMVPEMETPMVDPMPEADVPAGPEYSQAHQWARANAAAEGYASGSTLLVENILAGSGALAVDGVDQTSSVEELTHFINDLTQAAEVFGPLTSAAAAALAEFDRIHVGIGEWDAYVDAGDKARAALLLYGGSSTTILDVWYDDGAGIDTNGALNNLRTMINTDAENLTSSHAVDRLNQHVDALNTLVSEALADSTLEATIVSAIDSINGLDANTLLSAATEVVDQATEVLAIADASAQAAGISDRAIMDAKTAADNNQASPDNEHLARVYEAQKNLNDAVANETAAK